MSALSITFHFNENRLQEWNNNLLISLQSLINDTPQVKDFIISEVHTEYIEEGKNYNILLFFSDENARESFLSQQLAMLDQSITQQFGNNIMLFATPLNIIVSNFA